MLAVLEVGVAGVVLELSGCRREPMLAIIEKLRELLASKGKSSSYRSIKSPEFEERGDSLLARALPRELMP